MSKCFKGFIEIEECTQCPYLIYWVHHGEYIECAKGAFEEYDSGEIEFHEITKEGMLHEKCPLPDFEEYE